MSTETKSIALALILPVYTTKDGDRYAVLAVELAEQLVGRFLRPREMWRMRMILSGGQEVTIPLGEYKQLPLAAFMETNVGGTDKAVTS